MFYDFLRSDPDPDNLIGSGSGKKVRIRADPDPDPQHLSVGCSQNYGPFNFFIGKYKHNIKSY